ncbi:putative RNA-directed DNA polymerase from transposon BS [Trichonephila clavipes]|nr:putative RNA-directed DNA polymerase from transposon BS [Trichonephila clavipes]
MDPEILCPGKGLVLPNISIDTIATNSRFLILSLPNHEMSQKSPFAIQKALKGIGGDPKSVKKLRSGDLLIETVSALQTKSFLSAKVFLDCPLIVTPHRSLNSCRGVISEPDLLCASEAEILEGLSDQGVTQAHSADSKLCPKWKAEKQIQEIKTNKNITYIEARKLIAPPPLTLTYSQAAKSSITSASTQTDENITKIIKCPLLELLQPASSNSKQNKTTSIPTVSTSSTQAHLLRSTFTISKSQPHIPKIPVSNDLPSVTIPSTSAILPTIQKEALLPIPILTSTTTSFTGNSLNTSSLKTGTRLFPTTSNKFAALSTEIRPSVSLSESEATASNNEPSNTSKISKRLKRNSKNRKRRAKEQKAEIEVKMTPHTPKKSYIHYDSEEEDMIIYNVDEKLMDDHVRSGYSHFLTPTRNRRN